MADFLGTIGGLIRAITAPSRKVRDYTKETVKQVGMAPFLPGPLRLVQDFEAITRLAGMPRLSQPIRNAEAEVMGEITRTATNPLELGLIALSPVAVPSRLARAVIGGALGAGIAIGEEESGKEVAKRAGIIATLNALIPGAKSGTKIASEAAESIAKPIASITGKAEGVASEASLARAVMAKTSGRMQKAMSKVPQAVTETPEYIPEMAPGKYSSINLNLNRLQTTDDVKFTIDQWSQANEAALAEDYAKFSKGNFKQNLSDDLLRDGIDIDEITYGKKYNLGSVEGQKEILRDTHALRQVVVGIGERKTSLNAIINSPTATELEKRAALADIIKLDHEMMAVRLSLQRRTQFAGQFLNFLKQMAKPTDPHEAKVAALHKLIRSRFKANPEDAERIIQALGEINDANPHNLIRVLQETMLPPKGQDIFWEVFYNNLLSALPTHEVNLIGNTAKLISESLVVRPASTAIEQTAALVAGRTPEATLGSLKWYYTGMVRGIDKGLKGAYSILRRGYDPAQLIEPDKWAAYKFEAIGRHKNPAIRKLSPLVNAWSRALKASDAIFRSAFSEADKLQRAANVARKTGRTMEDVLTNMATKNPEILTTANEYASYGTFTDLPGKFTRAVEKFVKDVPAFRVVIPFVRIAGNLMKQGTVDYSPAKIVPIMNRLRNGVGIDKLKRSEELVRMGIGTMLMVKGVSMYKRGLVTLNAPEDPLEREIFYGAEGKQPYSVAIGNYWVPIRRIEPFVTPFIIGAIIAREIEDGRLEGRDAYASILNGATEISRFLVDSSFLSGVERFSTIFSGGYDPAGKMNQFLSNLGVNVMVPWSSMARNIRQATDPVVRDPRSFPEYMMNALPGLSKNVRPRLDQFGNPIQSVTKGAMALSFIRPSQPSNDMVLQELNSLNVWPGKPDRIQGRIKLTVDDYNKLLKKSGNDIYQKLAEIISSDFYQRMDLNKRKAYLESMIGSMREVYRRKARYQLFGIP